MCLGCSVVSLSVQGWTSLWMRVSLLCVWGVQRLLCFCARMDKPVEKTVRLCVGMCRVFIEQFYFGALVVVGGAVQECLCPQLAMQTEPQGSDTLDSFCLLQLEVFAVAIIGMI